MTSLVVPSRAESVAMTRGEDRYASASAQSEVESPLFTTFGCIATNGPVREA